MYSSCAIMLPRAGRPPQLLHAKGDQEKFHATEIPEGCESIAEASHRAAQWRRIEEFVIGGRGYRQIESLLISAPTSCAGT